MSDQVIDRTRITFSQAEGIDPLPQPTAIGELSVSARTRFWNITYESLSRSAQHFFNSADRELLDPWATLLYDYHTLHMVKPADEFTTEYGKWSQEIKSFFLNGNYNHVFDFLQFILRHRSVPRGFRHAVARVLRNCMCAYTVVNNGSSTTIVPIAIPEQRESIQKAFNVLQSGPFEGAQLHLRKSAEHINNANLAGSVRESIHAVESVARRLDGAAASSLKPALDSLSRRVALHGAFKKGIENLYGYTSDEDGIRHALLEDQANVDTVDAVFLFGACASFAAYLVNKARIAGLLKP